MAKESRKMHAVLVIGGHIDRYHFGIAFFTLFSFLFRWLRSGIVLDVLLSMCLVVPQPKMVQRSNQLLED